MTLVTHTHANARACLLSLVSPFLLTHAEISTKISLQLPTLSLPSPPEVLLCDIQRLSCTGLEVLHGLQAAGGGDGTVASGSHSIAASTYYMRATGVSI